MGLKNWDGAARKRGVASLNFDVGGSKSTLLDHDTYDLFYISVVRSIRLGRQSALLLYRSCNVRGGSF